MIFAKPQSYQSILTMIASKKLALPPLPTIQTPVLLPRSLSKSKKKAKSQLNSLLKTLKLEKPWEKANLE